MVGETTSITATTGMLAMLSNATMAVRDVATKLSGLGETSRLLW